VEPDAAGRPGLAARRGLAAAHGLAFGAASVIVLAAAVVQAVYHVVSKPLLARYSGFEVTAYAMWAATVFLLPFTVPAVPIALGHER
jgi:drug/metabolite transporter (DMT)-like permease